MTPSSHVIHPLEPELCRRCRFAEIDPTDSLVEYGLVRCRRLDCDNYLCSPDLSILAPSNGPAERSPLNRFLHWLGFDDPTSS